MADAVQPDPATIQQLLSRSRSLWSSYAATTTDPRLPAECAQLRSLLCKVPAFPTSSLQAHEKLSALRYHHSRFGVRIGGISTWRTSLGECDLPPKMISHELLYGVFNSVGCSFAECSRFMDWPGVQEGDGQTTEREGQTIEGNHLTILFLAWAYILSARWIELQSPHTLIGSCPLGGIHYSDLQAARLRTEEDISAGAIVIDIGEKAARAARWWAAILAPGEGWRATIELQDTIYRSPWSAHITSSQILQLRNADVGFVTYEQFETTPSSDEALEYLGEYCEYHGISSQCIPALAASLFLPWKNSDKGASAVLPLPQPCRNPRSKPSPSSVHFQRSLQDESRLLPYYMTLSCNVWGLRALLSGSFFNPAVSCNLVDPWIQPIFEIIDSVIARGDYTSFATIMSTRQPTLAGLWLGAIILGMEKTVLQSVRNGLFAVELHAAAWTGTVHSFINLISHKPCIIGNEKISRPDECRLLYITGSESYQKAPVCPWQPFGTTPLDLADIEVRKHATCTGHCLHYINWRWDTDNGSCREDGGFDQNAIVDQWGATSVEFDLASASAQTEDILRSNDLSQAASRSVLGWLRQDGYPPCEKAIFTHDWFYVGSSSEESAMGDDDAPVTEQSVVHEWLDRVYEIKS
jgi:hypothetical protein